MATAQSSCGCSVSGLGPRSCYDCLNTRHQSGEKCLVTPLGICMTELDAAVFKQYFNSTNSTDPQAINSVTPMSGEYFSSANATYCEASDATCSACRVLWIGDYRADAFRVERNFSCTGTGGCVCTAYCELRDYGDLSIPASYNFGQAACTEPATGSSTVNMQMIIKSGVLVIGAIVLAISVRRGVRLFHQERYERQLIAERVARRQQRNATRRNGIALSLVGWTGYRNELIEREQQSFGLKTEPLLTDAPARVVVQEGEGFRPASPSQLAREHTARLS